MGKRGKVSPTKDEKSKDNQKKKQVVQENSSSRSSDVGSGSDAKLEKLKVVVLIDSLSRRLAEQALSKVAEEEKAQENKAPVQPPEPTLTSAKETVQSSPKRNPSTQRKLRKDSQRKESSRSNLRSQVQNPDQTDRPTVSPTTRRRRKALTKALKSLRNKPQRPRRSRRTSLRLSSPLKLSLRTRKPSLPTTEKEKTESKNTRKRSLSFNSTKMNSLEENQVERASSPSDASNNSSPSSPESEERNEGKSSHESGGSDSDDDVQMQVLEKQVESDKEEDNDSSPEISLNLPDDTDEESSLLSPSALPASQVFRYPKSRRKKRKSLTDGPAHKRLGSSNLLLTSTSISSTTMPVPFYKLPAMPITPSTKYTHSPSIYTPPPSGVASRPSSLNLQGSLPEKRGRGRPRKALADVKSVSGKLYRKKLAERMASSSVVEQRHAQNIYDFHIEHSDEIEPFSYPPLSNPFEDFDPMSSVHHMREFYNYDAGPSSSDLPTDPQHMRHRLHRWGDKSTFVYAKHKFVSNENKFKCDVCEVSFTALSSLKRHYGTIYHKQQEAAGRSTLDLSDILRPDRDGNLMEPGPPSGPPLSYFTGNRGRGRGRPALARTSSFVRRSAVDNIKKYYALADAARRRRENYSTSAVTTTSKSTTGFTSSWMQKQQRKRKPLHHSDYLYPSASAESEADDFGCEDEDEENIENGNDENEIDERSVTQKPWLSNVWKGIGPAHFTCEYCGEVYKHKKEFTRHLFCHRQEEAAQLALTCPDCSGCFKTEYHLEQHFINFNHGVGMITEDRGKRHVQKLECLKCDSKFVRREYYRKHMEIHKRPLLPCPHCPKKFLYKFYLNDHIKAKHDGLTNDLSNIIANDDNVVGGLTLPTNLVVNNSNSVNDITNNITNTNNFSRPKVELFSTTTPLLTPAEISKRKSQTVASESNENQPNVRNSDIPSTISKKRHSTPAATSMSRDIPVPNYITCDPLMENDAPERTPTREGYGNKDNYETTFETDLTRTLTPTGSASKGRVSLLQKFLDSQKEQLNQNLSEKVERKNDDDLDNGSSSNSNVVSTSSGLSGIGHSTTEDGKIVFQLEHSMFKGFTSMSSGDGDENACNMSPLTIEIPRDNINLDLDAASEEDEQKNNTECNKKPEETSDVGKGVAFHTPVISPSFNKEDGEPEKDRITPLDGNSNSSALSAFQLLGCGVKANPPMVVDSGNELQCQDCGKIFEHKKSLIKHVRYYTQMESYSCTLCDRSFKLKHHVSRHMKSYHNVDNSSTTSSTSDDINLEDSGEIDCMNSPSGSRGDSFIGGLLAIPSSSSSVTPLESTLSDSRKQEPSMLTSPHFKNRTFGSVERPTTGRKRSTSDSAKKKLDLDYHGPSTSFSKSNYTTVMDSNGSPVFKCLICKKLYPTKNQLNSHLWYHKRSIPYRCTTCSAEFKFKHDLNAHQQDHYMSERTKFTCEKCSDKKSFISRKDFLKHMREIHHYLGRKAPPPPAPPSTDSPEKDPLNVSVSRCPLCPLVFPQESDLHEHISSDHSKKEVVVCRCGQILGNTELLKTHMLQEHQVNEDGDVENDESLLEQKQNTDDNDKPIILSPQNSPVYIMKQSDPEDELDDEDELDEGEPSSSEFELMDVN